MDLLDLFVKLSIDDDDFDKGLDNVKNKISSLSKVAAGVGIAAGAVAGTVAAVKAVGEAVVNGTAELAAYGDNIDKMSQKMGMSAEAYQEWDAVMQHSGTSMETLKASMKTLANAAQTGNEAFQKLGITQEQIASMSQEELFSATITALQNVTDETERTYLAGQTLGRGATELGALLNTSAEETQAMKDRVHELGGVMSDEAVKASAQFQDNLQDMNTAIDGVKRSIQAEFLPSLNLLMEGFTSLIANEEGAEEKLVEGFEKLVDGFEGAVKKIEPIAKTLIPRIVEFAIQSLPDIANLSLDIVDTLVDTILDNVGNLLTAATEIIYSLADGLSTMLPELMPAVVNIVVEIVDTLLDNQDQLIDAALQLITALADGLAQSLPILLEKAPEIIIKLTTALIENLYKLSEVPQKIFDTIADGLVHVDWTETAEKMMDGLVSALDVAQKKVKLWIDNAREALTGESLYDGDINNVATTEFVKNLDENKNVVVDAIDKVTGDIRTAYDSYYGTAEEGMNEVIGYNEEALGKMADAQANAIENAGKTTEDAIAAVMAKRAQAGQTIIEAVEETEEDAKAAEEALKKRFEELETQMYSQGLSEEWLVKQERAYVEALNHSTDLYKEYNLKLLKEEQKIAQAADSRRKDEVEKYFQMLEDEANKNSYTDEWLTKQQRAYIETLDHNTDLYAEYNSRLLKSERQIREATEKQRKEDAENTKKSFTSMIDDMVQSAKSKIEEYEKAIENIKSQIKSFGESLISSFKDMFKFDVDEETGKMTATKTKDYITNATKQLEEYYDTIQQLRSKGISENLLNQLTSMSAEEGLAVAQYYNSLSEGQLNTLNSKWNRYEQAGQMVSEALYADEMETATKELDETRNTLLDEIKNKIDENITVIKEAIANSGDATININGIQYQNMSDLVNAVAAELGFKSSRRGAGYAV